VLESEELVLNAVCSNLKLNMKGGVKGLESAIRNPKDFLEADSEDRRFSFL
jgi:hypothetical protein